MAYSVLGPLCCLLVALICFVSVSNGNDEEAVLGCDEANEIPATKSSKQLYSELKANLKSIRESCGEICDTSKTGVPGLSSLVLIP